jgi:hypothetical protein
MYVDTTSQVLFVSCWQTVNAVNMEKRCLKTEVFNLREVINK